MVVKTFAIAMRYIHGLSNLFASIVCQSVLKVGFLLSFFKLSLFWPFMGVFTFADLS